MQVCQQPEQSIFHHYRLSGSSLFWYSVLGLIYENTAVVPCLMLVCDSWYSLTSLSQVSGLILDQQIYSQFSDQLWNYPVLRNSDFSLTTEAQFLCMAVLIVYFVYVLRTYLYLIHLSHARFWTDRYDLLTCSRLVITSTRYSSILLAVIQHCCKFYTGKRKLWINPGKER